MAKQINVNIPRNAIQELLRDKDFATKLYNAILQSENTNEETLIKIGNAKKKAVVSILES
jgi:hypothetical protein